MKVSSINTRSRWLDPRLLVALVSSALLALAVVVGSALAAPKEDKKSEVAIQSDAFAEGEKFLAFDRVELFTDTPGPLTTPIKELRGQKLAGEVVHVGRGCPAGSIDGSNPDDPYLADPAGKIALVEGRRIGVDPCRFDQKIARAQLAGAIGVVAYFPDSTTWPWRIGGENPVTLADGTVVELEVPAVSVFRDVGLLLRDAAPVRAQLKATNQVFPDGP